MKKLVIVLILYLTLQVTVTVCGKDLVKMEKILTLWVEDMNSNMFDCTRKHLASIKTSAGDPLK
jgi:hypothetical protein